MATASRKPRKTAKSGKAASKTKGKKRRSSVLRDEYKAALDDFNNYSHNNETVEAVDARARLDKADRARNRWTLS